ncbi:2091_t:CDS:2 [Cetraspora pellucida]|uniref:2091_t:CDS:1 n=1 Tax=Cetraspora pellucida TaxID=1433469 RepID=A0A9N9P3N6_9GLOM|nr:2091_t:CDS:2 [Cetraspora pellucida]
MNALTENEINEIIDESIDNWTNYWNTKHTVDINRSKKGLRKFINYIVNYNHQTWYYQINEFGWLIQEVSCEIGSIVLNSYNPNPVFTQELMLHEITHYSQNSC